MKPPETATRTEPARQSADRSSRANELRRILRHVRAIGVLLALSILITGGLYPAAVTGFAQLVVPGSANGSLLHAANGTVVGSALLGENLTSVAYLFWPRPSLSDYSYFLGAPTPPAVVDPQLVNLTLYYMALYGPYAVNVSVPLSLVSVSASSLDPDITPEAALVQIPRVANASGLSQLTLMAFLLEHVVLPLAGFVGPPYVDVMTLDLALLPVEGR
jgi:potassium-transporting ATPase KdpC subunit